MMRHFFLIFKLILTFEKVRDLSRIFIPSKGGHLSGSTTLFSTRPGSCARKIAGKELRSAASEILRMGLPIAEGGALTAQLT